jgi:uncharacterized damage-inducible protein DinB
VTAPTPSIHRIEEAAQDLEAANRDLAEFLSGVSLQQWRTARTPEGWPLIGAAYHVADGYRIHMRWLDRLRKAEPIPGGPADLDEENARTIADAEELTVEVVMSAVQTGGRLLVAYLKDLDADELKSSARHGPLEEDVSVDDMLDITVWHVQEHLSTMRAVVSTASS